jgi:hypothetical protein
MALHLIKLCVGVSSLDELIEWRDEVLAQKKKKKQPLVYEHTTRQMPKQRDEILNGGSLYWVIAGQIACRSPILDLKPCIKNGIPHCRIVMAPQTIRTHPRPHHPFQGWRYLKAADAPPDIAGQVKASESEILTELRRFGVG